MDDTITCMYYIAYSTAYASSDLKHIWFNMHVTYLFAIAYLSYFMQQLAQVCCLVVQVVVQDCGYHCHANIHNNNPHAHVILLNYRTVSCCSLI